MTNIIKPILVAATLATSALAVTGANAMNIMNCSSIDVRVHVFNANDAAKSIPRANARIAEGDRVELRKSGSDTVALRIWESRFLDRHSNWAETDAGGYSIEGVYNYTLYGNYGNVKAYYVDKLPASC